MLKQLAIGLFVISLITVSAIAVSAGVRNSGGSFFYCPPGTDLNGDGIGDCSYRADLSWIGGYPGDAITINEVAVKKGYLICDNNGKAFKVTLPGNGTVTAVDIANVTLDTTDNKGKFTTSSEFLNRVDDFATLQDFRDYWGLVGNQCRNQTMTEIEVRIQELLLTGQVGSKCTDPSDLGSCESVSEAVYNCSTSRPFDEAIVVYTCK